MDEEKVERLTTVLSYKVINSKGIETINVPEIRIADQSPASASMLLINLVGGLLDIAKAQTEA